MPTEKKKKRMKKKEKAHTGGLTSFLLGGTSGADIQSDSNSQDVKKPPKDVITVNFSNSLIDNKMRKQLNQLKEMTSDLEEAYLEEADTDYWQKTPSEWPIDSDTKPAWIDPTITTDFISKTDFMSKAHRGKAYHSAYEVDHSVKAGFLSNAIEDHEPIEHSESKKRSLRDRFGGNEDEMPKEYKNYRVEEQVKLKDNFWELTAGTFIVSPSMFKYEGTVATLRCDCGSDYSNVELRFHDGIIATLSKEHVSPVPTSKLTFKDFV